MEEFIGGNTFEEIKKDRQITDEKKKEMKKNQFSLVAVDYDNKILNAQIQKEAILNLVS